MEILYIFLLPFLPFILLYKWAKFTFEHNKLTGIADKWEQPCLEAHKDLNTLRNTTHLFTDKEKIEYIRKYQNLFNSVSVFDIQSYVYQSEYSSEFKEKYNTDDKKNSFRKLKNRLIPISYFCSDFQDIDKIQADNHSRHAKYMRTLGELKWVVDTFSIFENRYIPHYISNLIANKIQDIEAIETCIHCFSSQENKNKYVKLFRDFSTNILPLFRDKQKDVEKCKKEQHHRDVLSRAVSLRHYEAKIRIEMMERYRKEDEEELKKILNRPTFAEWVKQHNERFIAEEKDRQKEYFDTLFEYPLDQQQREAIVTDEDNNLVIASAGSGKTSTIVGKTHYLVEQLNVNPQDILVVTYTRKAAEELRERIGVDGVTCATFNSHALTTIGKITGKKPDISDGTLLNSIFYSILNSDEKYLEAANKYSTILVDRADDTDSYATAQERVSDMQKYGKMSPYPDMDGNRIFLKSKQEKLISIILTELGIKFRYEEAYDYDTTTEYKRRYRPDFVIHYDVNELDEDGKEITVHKKLYFEHFGVDANGNVPKWFGDGVDGGYLRANANYKAGMQWKKELHNKFGTDLIYTTSADFMGDGDIKTHIIYLLRQHNVPINFLTEQQKRERMQEVNGRIDDSLELLISGFITLMKANQYDLQDLINQQRESDDENAERNAFILEYLVKPVYSKYQAELKERNQIDFTDSLLLAANLCKANNPYDYKYILVDEFQDMSLDKYAYLKSLRVNDGEMFTRLFCVGDDWQSIYRFSGSDMTLFYDFANKFGTTAECKIETTHRFGEPLLATSSKFILTNPEQKKKDVKTTSSDTDIKLRGHRSAETKDVVRDIIKTIPVDESIYVLGRYKNGVSVLAPKGRKLDYDPNYIHHIEGHDVKYLTVHSAKGLEADNVIVINCDNGGFPSTIEDDPILSIVLSGADSFDYAEERRLFYVAITRAKKCTYVLYDNENPSPFIQEFGEYRKSSGCTDIKCPRCHNGYVRILKDSHTKEGKRFLSVNCSNNFCDFFENVFDGDIYRYIPRTFFHVRYDYELLCGAGIHVTFYNSKSKNKKHLKKYTKQRFVTIEQVDDTRGGAIMVLGHYYVPLNIDMRLITVDSIREGKYLLGEIIDKQYEEGQKIDYTKEFGFIIDAIAEATEEESKKLAQICKNQGNAECDKAILITEEEIAQAITDLDNIHSWIENSILIEEVWK